MKNRLCCFAFFLILSILAGCTKTVRFYPVTGPLAAQNPLPVYTAKITFGANPKSLSVVLADGEVCKGNWSLVPRDKSPSTTFVSGTGAHSMQEDWDAVYGTGFYVSHVLGAKYYAQSKASGDKGTIVTAELYRPENVEERNVAASVKGVARDNNGNVYKLVIQ